MSLDGFVADENDDISALYGGLVANVDQSPELEDMTYINSGQEFQGARSAACGAIVAGRRTFDLAKGVGRTPSRRRPRRGRHP